MKNLWSSLESCRQFILTMGYAFIELKSKTKKQLKKGFKSIFSKNKEWPKATA